MSRQDGVSTQLKINWTPRLMRFFADVDNLDEPVVAPIIDHDEHPTTVAPHVHSETLPSSPAPPPMKSHSFPKAEDINGQANVRRKTKSSSRPLPSSSHQLPPPSQPEVSILHPKPEFSASAASQTTVWRHKKERDEGKQVKMRNIYTCKVCSQPMTTEGHTQFRGQRYCPHAPGQIPQDEWLKRKEEAARKKQQGPSPQ